MQCFLFVCRLARFLILGSLRLWMLHNHIRYIFPQTLMFSTITFIHSSKNGYYVWEYYYEMGNVSNKNMWWTNILCLVCVIHIVIWKTKVIVHCTCTHKSDVTNRKRFGLIWQITFAIVTNETSHCLLIFMVFFRPHKCGCASNKRSSIRTKENIWLSKDGKIKKSEFSWLLDSGIIVKNLCSNKKDKYQNSSKVNALWWW